MNDAIRGENARLQVAALRQHFRAGNTLVCRVRERLNPMVCDRVRVRRDRTIVVHAAPGGKNRGWFTLLEVIL